MSGFSFGSSSASSSSLSTSTFSFPPSSGIPFGSSSASSYSQSTSAFSFSNPPSSGISYGSSVPSFGSTTATSSSPFGFGSSSTSTSSSFSAPSSSFPFNVSTSSTASLFGTAPFGTISSAATSATSGFALFGTASSASRGLFGTSSSDSPFSTLTTLSASSSCSALTTPAFRFSSGSFSSSSSERAFGDAGDEGEQVAREVVKNPMCPNSVEEAKNVSAAAASKAFSAVDEEKSAETSPLSSLCVEVGRHVPSPHNVPIIKRILQKHGDITNGSIIRSLEAKWAFLDLIGDVVNRLCNHTLETLSSHELQLIEANVADAVAVGFKVEWLQQRVDEIKAAKYQACSKELDELDIQIEAAKTSLMEMELRREDLARDVAAIKAKIEGKGFLGCTLSEGLL